MLNIMLLNRTRAKGVVDGKQQKKRGPKTDSKPALNSKQEKNRQAQRYACPYLACIFFQRRGCFAPAKPFSKSFSLPISVDPPTV